MAIICYVFIVFAFSTVDVHRSDGLETLSTQQYRLGSVSM